MENEALAIQIRDLLLEIESSREAIEEEYKKFQVALSSVLRLIDGNNQMLGSLHGSPEDLKGFLLNLTTELRRDTISHWKSLKPKIEYILSNITEASDRKY